MPDPDPAPRPTDAELDVLRALWELGPATVRDVRAALQAAREREVGYTTALKTLQIMTDKGLVEREERGRAHVYRAARPAEDTRRRLVEDLLERAFGGASGRLALHALGAGRPDAEELAELRALLDDLEGDAGGGGAP